MGTPLKEYLLAKKFDAGIEISKRFPGEVPEFECREAAVFVHVSWHAWTTEMDGYDRACAVAHYRTSNSIKAHVEDAAERAAARKRGRKARHTSQS